MGDGRAVNVDVDDVDVEAPVVGGGRKEGKPKLDRWEEARQKKGRGERQRRKPEGVTGNEKDREQQKERERDRDGKRERDRKREGLVLSEEVSSG